MSKRAEAEALKTYPYEDGIKGMICENSRYIFIQGYEQAERDLIPLINQLCEAILFEWKDAAELARKTLIQIKGREE